MSLYMLSTHVGKTSQQTDSDQSGEPQIQMEEE